MSLRPASSSTTTPTIVTTRTSFHNFIAGSLSRHLPNAQFIPASPACHSPEPDWPRSGPVGGHPTTGPDELEFTSQGHALLHVMEEVCQHLGQMEITRDLLRQP
jgi:hypothetical protein